MNDFTLDEIKSLHVNQRVKGVRTGIYDKIFQILTFEEYIDIVLDYSKTLKRVIGMVPELKHPRYLFYLHLDDLFYIYRKYEATTTIFRRWCPSNLE